MKNHRLLTHVCLHQIDCLCYCCYTQKLVLLRPKNVTAKCTETLSPPPSIQYLLAKNVNFKGLKETCTPGQISLVWRLERDSSGISEKEWQESNLKKFPILKLLFIISVFAKVCQFIIYTIKTCTSPPQISKYSNCNCKIEYIFIIIII